MVEERDFHGENMPLCEPWLGASIEEDKIDVR